MKFLNKMKKNQKGFTLVEIIVVLVILAVLAAFTIPTMLGFVNEAKGKAYIAEAREVYVAAQATATEYTANGTVFANDAALNTALGSAAVWGTDPSGPSLTMFNYLDTDLNTTNPATWTVTTVDGKVNIINYTRGGYTVTLTAGGSTTVVKN